VPSTPDTGATLASVHRPQLRRPRAETAIAWAAAAVGGISVVSALTPEMSNRSDLVQAALPPGVPHAARVAALAFGLALVWLSRGLAQRRRRAWQLAVGLVVFTAAAHVAKGLDVEEASAGLVLLGLLLAYRRRYDVPGDPATRRPALALGIGLAAAFALPGAVSLAWLHVPDRLDDLVDVAAGLLAYATLYLWLRPLGERVRQSVEGRRQVRRALERHGDDSLDFFALRRDKSWFFSPSGRSFLAYRVVGGAALVSGEPVGPEEELRPLLEEFRRLCRVRGWRLAVLSVRDESLPLFRSIGLRSVKLGDEAVIRPETFSLEGRAIRKVRQSVTRLRKGGYRVAVLRAGDAAPELRAELERLSAEWRGNAPERGFTMAMDSLFAEADTLLAVASGPDGRAGGFLHLVRSPADGGLSLSAMRRSRSTPNGLMEFLVAETIAWAREAGVPELSLNFCIFTDVLHGGAGRSALVRALRFALLRLDSLFQIERLHAFNRKFFPEWRSRHVCFERLADAPVVGLAYLRAESLLTPPVPWTRRRERVGA
jgi:lysyl-tRNA synthetase, class II